MANELSCSSCVCRERHYHAIIRPMMMATMMHGDGNYGDDVNE